MANNIQIGRQRCRPVRSGDACVEELERCVLCWQLTGVPKTMPVSRRKGYIEGAGQLCESCCCELLKKGVFFCEEL